MKTMINQILSILNPVHLVSCEEWMKISELFEPKKSALKLIIRYERLTSQILTKEMFVREPISVTTQVFTKKDSKEYLKEVDQAQSKVWFEGFEIKNQFAVQKKPLIVHFGNIGASISVNEYWTTGQIKDCTVFYFIIEINRYNRTAEKKIEIKWTENFVKELLK